MVKQSVILFGTGAKFSVAVLENLLADGLVPTALVLPEYAPSSIQGSDKFQVEIDRQSSQFLSQAQRLSIPLIYLPETSQSSSVEKIASVKSDFMLVACWPYLLCPQIISAVARAAINLHPSLLPKYRGADPVTAQIVGHEKNMGVTLHLLSQEFDKGDIVAQADLECGTGNPGRDLIEMEAARVGTRLFLRAIQDFDDPGWKPAPQ